MRTPVCRCSFFSRECMRDRLGVRKCYRSPHPPLRQLALPFLQAGSQGCGWFLCSVARLTSADCSHLRAVQVQYVSQPVPTLASAYNKPGVQPATFPAGTDWRAVHNYFVSYFLQRLLYRANGGVCFASKRLVMLMHTPAESRVKNRCINIK